MSSGRIPSVEGGIQPTVVDAKGDLIVATAADTVSRLAVGSNDQVLTADSSTATGLKWAAASSGGMTLLSTTTLSGASTTISSISGAYTHLFVNIYGVSNSTADGVFRMWANGTTNIANHTRENFSSGYFNSVINDKIILLPTSTTILRTDTNNAFSVMIYNYSSTSQIKPISGSGMFYDPTNGSSLGAFLSGGIKTTSAITSLSFENTGGNWAGGTVLIYGVK